MHSSSLKLLFTQKKDPIQLYKCTHAASQTTPNNVATSLTAPYTWTWFVLHQSFSSLSSFRVYPGSWKASRSSPGTIPSGLLTMPFDWPGRKAVVGSPLYTRPTSCELLWRKCMFVRAVWPPESYIILWISWCWECRVWPFCSDRKLGDGLFLQCCREVASGYPDITFDSMIVDNTTMQVIRRLNETPLEFGKVSRCRYISTIHLPPCLFVFLAGC